MIIVRMNQQLFTCAMSLCIASISNADIYQWYDGDGDQSIWLSESTAVPYADFSGQNLWWADLDWANLHHSNFEETNLMFAHLTGSNFAHSILTSSNLFNAVLSEANLSFANLSYADLSFANVYGANLFSANLTDANLTGIGNWDQAFWMGATYNQNTIFPFGMDPEADCFGMIFVPAPSALALLSIAAFTTRRRRS